MKKQADLEARQSIKKELDIALCADLNMEAPLHVAAASVLRRASGAFQIRFNFLLPNFNDASKKRLRETLDGIKRPYSVQFLQTPKAELFRGLKPFHGNMTCYYRFAFPELIEADRFLYIDADTVTRTDITTITEIPMQSYALGAVATGTVSQAKERKFFKKLGLPDSTPEFNSGVLLVDVQEWRRQKRSSEIFEFCRRYPNELAGDQTALVGVFAGNFLQLPACFNIPLYADTPLKKNEDGICHFVGSPKPWDLFGNVMHLAYSVYREDLEETSFAAQPPAFFELQKWRRAYHVKGGYYRTVRNRLFRNT